MFFSNRLESIGVNDLVLEIGPGGTPHPRSDVFLEKRFSSSQEALGQRGYASELKTDKEIIFYDGKTFPIKDKQFDYIICSHVLEHVDDIDFFLSEVVRVGKKGYLEYPTIYYDYLYNFPEHITFLKKRGNVLLWMPKSESGLDKFKPVHQLFYKSLEQGHDELILSLKNFLFEGFEWFNSINSEKVNNLELLTFNNSEITLSKNIRKRVETNIFAKGIRQIFKIRSAITSK